MTCFGIECQQNGGFKAYTKLDFSHLRKERIGYARHRSIERGERCAYPTNRDDTGFGTVCATVLRTSLAVCPGALDGGDPRPRKTDGEFRLTYDGFGSTEAVPWLPSSVEPSEVVHQRGEPRPVGIASRSFRPGGSARLGRR